MADSDILSIRIPAALARRLAREARRRGLSPSTVAREVLASALDPDGAGGLSAEARRQSLLVQKRRSERDALRFVTSVSDLEGWE